MDHRDIMVDLETIADAFEAIATAFIAPPEMEIFVIRILLIQCHYKSC